MASIKARKGNPFEREVAYNFQALGYKVTRLNDNSPGADLIADNGNYKFIIECKCHKGFTWNELTKMYDKTAKYAGKHGARYMPMLVFKGNRQPPLVMVDYDSYETEYIHITPFTTFFSLIKWLKVPKGWKVWQ